MSLRVKPRRFRTRLILMTLAAGLIPIVLVTIQLRTFNIQFRQEAGKAVSQLSVGEREQTDRILVRMSEDAVRQKAVDVARQVDLYLEAHPGATLADLRKDSQFRGIAVQPAGKTGWTSLQETRTATLRFHENRSIENRDLKSLLMDFPQLQSIMEESRKGRPSEGYHGWAEPDGTTRRRFTHIVPVAGRTADGVRLSAAATTSLDESTQSAQLHRDAEIETGYQLKLTIDSLVRSFRSKGSLFMGLGILIALAMAYWTGTYLSKTVSRLKSAMERLNQGDFDVFLKPSVSGEMGELVEGFNRMAAQLKSTTVSKRVLEESEQRFRTLAETTSSGILIFRDETITYANPAAEQITGFSFDELKGMNFWHSLNPDAQSLIKEAGHRLSGDEYISYKTYETRIVAKDGSERWIDVAVGSTLLDGRLADTVTMVDITERKRAESYVIAERQRFAALTESAPFGMAMMATDETFQYVNPRFKELFGYDLEDLPNGEAWLQRAYPDENYRQQVVSEWNRSVRAVAPGRAAQAAFTVACKDGTRKTVNFTSTRLEGGDFVMTCEDVTEMIQAERALRESELKYRNIVEQSLVGVYVVQDNRFKFVNQKFCDIHGDACDEVMESGSLPYKVHPEDRKGVEENIQRLLDGHVASTEYDCRIVLDDGEIRRVKAIATMSSYQGRPAIIGTLLDTSKEEILERQLLQSQKLETVGRLAGGIAHDFNNVLNIILGNAQLTKALISENAKAVNYCSSIEKAVFRAADFVKKLLAFSRRQLLELNVVDVNETLTDFTQMIHRVIGENIEMKVITGKQLPPVRADAAQIDQVLLNLVVNAKEAMPQGGQLVIETFSEFLSPEYCRLNPDARPGNYVVLSVTDTGTGITRQALGKIFEPFYSKKEMGTGLGLSVVYGIVKQHNGFINVYSEVGRGTTFKLYLPAASGEIERKEEEIRPAEKVRGETILIVEDEEPLRNIAAEILRTIGYGVLTAADGEEAIRLFGERSDEIDLALIDVVMPKLGGRETYEALRVIKPSVRSLFMTGYSLNGIHTNFILEHGIDAIQKPYSFEGLAKKIREVLDRT